MSFFELLRSREYDSVGLQFLCSPDEHKQWYSHWQKKRLHWWKKVSGADQDVRVCWRAQEKQDQGPGPIQAYLDIPACLGNTDVILGLIQDVYIVRAWCTSLLVISIQFANHPERFTLGEGEENSKMRDVANSNHYVYTTIQVCVHLQCHVNMVMELSEVESSVSTFWCVRCIHLSQ